MFQSNANRNLLRLWAWGLLSFVVIFFATLSVWPVQAERPPVQRQHFKSGSERSEELLREILSTLQRMDGRLERLEKSTDLISRGAPG